MVNVKCKYCKKELDKSAAYKVEYLTKSLNVRYKYYCNENCEREEIENKNNKFRLKELEKNTRELAREITGIKSDKNIYFSKMYKDLRETFGDKRISEYLYENKNYIEDVLNSKDFYTTNSKLKYFFAIMQNNIETFGKDTMKLEHSRQTFDDFNIKENNNDNKKRSIDDILNNL